MTPEEIVRRLRCRVIGTYVGDGVMLESIDTDIEAAADLIERQAKTLEEAEKAMEPFAGKFLYPDDVGEEFANDARSEPDWSEEGNDAYIEEFLIERAWIRRARAALATIRELKGE